MRIDDDLKIIRTRTGTSSTKTGRKRGLVRSKSELATTKSVVSWIDCDYEDSLDQEMRDPSFHVKNGTMTTTSETAASTLSGAKSSSRTKATQEEKLAPKEQDPHQAFSQKRSRKPPSRRRSQKRSPPLPEVEWNIQRHISNLGMEEPRAGLTTSMMCHDKDGSLLTKLFHDCLIGFLFGSEKNDDSQR